MNKNDIVDITIVNTKQKLDIDYGFGRPDTFIMDKTTYEAYLKLADPTRGMTKREKKFYKLLFK